MDKTLKDIIEKIDSFSKEEKEKLLNEIREKVILIDREIIELLVMRSDQSKLIGKLKSALNLPVLSLQREKDLLENLFKNLPSGILQDSIKRIYERIYDESRLIQRSQYQKKNTK